MQPNPFPTDWERGFIEGGQRQLFDEDDNCVFCGHNGHLMTHEMTFAATGDRVPVAMFCRTCDPHSAEGAVCWAKNSLRDGRTLDVDYQVLS